MNILTFSTTNRTIMQRCPGSDNPTWAIYHKQTKTETLADLQNLAAKLRKIFPAHEFEIR